jgi:hypothetical protein
MQINLQQRLDHVISKVHRELLDKQVLVPVYEKGKIIVGSVWIVSNEASKDIVKDNKLVYTSVALNKTAIALANMLAIVGKTTHQTDMLYRADQQYAVYMQETLFFKSKYKNAMANKKYDQADIFFARYEHAKEKANSHKNYVLTLIAY